MTVTGSRSVPAVRHPGLDLPTRVLRIASAAALAVSGDIHAQLYIDGYRFIHVVGVLFLVQAAVSFAVTVLLVTAAVWRPPVLVDLAGAGVALGALGGFAASRTVGVFGFIERGLQPAPQSLISILVEVAAFSLLAAVVVRTVRHGECRLIGRPTPEA